ncbi:MAG: hypothetical protein HQL91_07365 [Magnetococcales bacterium]|nr:hypothetical protein [Magnetococcales bacterium]
MSDFRTYIRDSVGAQPLPPILPLTHATLGGQFDEILTQGQLDPVADGLFPTPSIYFFYGRAAYRPDPRIDTESHQQAGFMPACFLMDRTKLPAAADQFPFDSGAFFGKRLANDLPETKIEKFALYNEVDCLRRCVIAFYQNNNDYFNLVPRHTLPISSPCGTVSNYHDLIKKTASNSFDGRAKTFEVRFDQKIELTANNVVAIVVPETWTLRQYLFNRLKSIGLADKIKFYKSDLGSPQEHMASLRQKVADILKDCQLLPGDQEILDNIFS